MAKKGRMSKEERDFIAKNAAKMSPEKIAQRIDRTPEMVSEFIKGMTGAKPEKATPAQIEVRKDLRDSAEWKELRKQFTDDELAYFEEQYATWMSQLKGDGFVASEETQVILLIKTQILMNRNLAEKRRAMKEMDSMEKMLDGVLASAAEASQLSESEKTLATDINEQLTAARSAQQAKTAELVKLQEKHADLMKQLKATRDQRLKRISDAKVSFVDVIKELMKEDERLRQGEHEELLRLAAQKERSRLSDLHEYADGQVDRPFLTPESVEAEAGASEEEVGEADEEGEAHVVAV